MIVDTTRARLCPESPNALSKYAVHIIMHSSAPVRWTGYEIEEHSKPGYHTGPTVKLKCEVEGL
jgi:hypothetical protein